EQTKAQVKEYTAQGKRVLLVAVSDDKIVDEKLPSTLREVALIVIEDTIRQDAIETIEWFKQNEVAVKVISGDDPLAVSVIAGRVGIKNFEQYINLDGLSE
ncbi:MAG: HAD family hydrolase, partial [Clostridia bacterium]